jgi:phosphomannomutase
LEIGLTASEKTDFERLFRAYDIRGVFPEQLNENSAAVLGAAVAEFLGKRSRVAVGRDVRLSGEQLRNGLVTGLVKGGCDVTD